MALLTADEHAVRRLITTADAIQAVRQAFLDLAAGRFEMPPRGHLGQGRFLAMSCRHRDHDSLTVKTLSVSPGRRPTIVGTASWCSADSQHTVTADAEPLTGLRTGAVVGVATDLLAAPDADHLMIFGAGAQSEDQIRAVHAVRPLRDVSVITANRDRGLRLCATLTGDLPDTSVQWVRLGEHDLRQAHIICCATPARSPLFDVAELPVDVHVNAIGSFRPDMCELPSELLATARTVVVDDRESCLAEAGEIIDAVSSGVLKIDRLRPLADLLSGPLAPRRAGRSVFKSVGLAIQDWAVVDLLARRMLADPRTAPATESA